jgi:ATP-dependent Clp protease ATP-binding subunit ClpC
MGMRENLEQNLDRVFQATKALAMSTNDSFMRVSHLVYATIAGNNIISQIVIDELNEAGSVDTMMVELKTNYEKETDNKLGNPDRQPFPEFGETLFQITNSSIGKLAKGELLLVETLFLKLYETNDPVIAILEKYKITRTMLLERVDTTRLASNVNMRDEEENDFGFKGKQRKNSKTPFLDDFGRDLTEMAALGKLDPVYGCSGACA